MATYTTYCKELPSSQRAAAITDCAVGDRINIKDVLGRSADKVLFKMTDPSDVIEYKINHLRRVKTPRSPEDSLSAADQVYGVFGREAIDLWAVADTFSETGSSQLEIASGLPISSIEIVSLTLSTGSTIGIEVS